VGSWAGGELGVVRVDDRLHDREPESLPVVVLGEQPLEQPRVIDRRRRR
jgi:hypothetical protein